MHHTIGRTKVKIVVDEIPEECDKCPFQEWPDCKLQKLKAFEGIDECPLEEDPDYFK